MSARVVSEHRPMSASLAPCKPIGSAVRPADDGLRPSRPPPPPPPLADGRLEESIFGIAPHDDLTCAVARFIWDHARSYWERGEGHLVEVEAKLGTLRAKQGGGRMWWPVGSETPVLETSETRFCADMAPAQHETLNRILNARVRETGMPPYTGARVAYAHLKQVDEFHDGRVRVSRDQNQQTPPKAIVKEKLAHLDVFCPGRPFDFRVSVNVEHPVAMPNEHAKPSYKRIKDRLSYSHQICQIDLTQVKTTEPAGSTHELEVEIKDPSKLLKAASIWSTCTTTNSDSQTQKHRSDLAEPGAGGAGEQQQGEIMGEEERQRIGLEYLMMVEVMLNNVRMLIRNCGS